MSSFCGKQGCQYLPNSAKWPFIAEFFSIADFCQNRENAISLNFSGNFSLELNLFFYHFSYVWSGNKLASSENFIVKNLQTRSIFKLFFKYRITLDITVFKSRNRSNPPETKMLGPPLNIIIIKASHFNFFDLFNFCFIIPFNLSIELG